MLTNIKKDKQLTTIFNVIVMLIMTLDLLGWYFFSDKLAHIYDLWLFWIGFILSYAAGFVPVYITQSQVKDGGADEGWYKALAWIAVFNLAWTNGFMVGGVKGVFP